MYNARMAKIFGYLIALIVLCGTALYLYDRVPRLPRNAGDTATTTLRVANVHEEESAYRIEASYPVTGVVSVDAAVKRAIEDAIAEFKTYPANPSDSAAPKNEFRSDIGPVYIGPDVVSVELLISEYTGGAHPNTAIVVINIDPRSGRALSLDDALALIGKTLDEVSAASTAQLREKLEDAFFEEGARPAPENFQTFMVTKDEVTFVFQNYQVAPYAAGPQFISFPRVQ